MKFLTQSVAALALASTAVLATPASAQVSGSIGIVNAPAAIAGTNAMRTAFAQIGTTYQAQQTQVEQKSQQRETLLRQLDTNGDGNLDQAEQQAAQNAPQVGQIQQLENEITQISNQIDGARIYAIEQIARQYGAAVQEVVQQNSLQVVLNRDAVAFAQPAASIDAKVAASLNTRVPSVQIVPPAEWQPSQQSVALYQQIAQLLLLAQVRQQQAQQQQPAAQQPTGR